MEAKRTEDEHANRVGCVIGPVAEKANMSQHNKMIKHLGKIEDGKAELKKKRVHEGPEDEWRIAVCSVQSAAENADCNLQRMSAEDETHIK